MNVDLRQGLRHSHVDPSFYLCNPFRVKMGLVLSTLPRVALRLPRANLCSPFGASGSDSLPVSLWFCPPFPGWRSAYPGLIYVAPSGHLVRTVFRFLYGFVHPSRGDAPLTLG